MIVLVLCRLGGDAGGELVHTVVHNNHNQPEVRFDISPSRKGYNRGPYSRLLSFILTLK